MDLYFCFTIANEQPNLPIPVLDPKSQQFFSFPLSKEKKKRKPFI